MPAAAIHLLERESTYLCALTERVRELLGSRVIGIYLFGSAAYGAYQPGRSDLDVQVVTAEPLTAGEGDELVRSLTHSALPCPARRLEFVCYARTAIDPASRHPQFSLNFNTGSALAADRVTRDPAQESSHWFLLDIAMGRALGRALYGPPPAEIFAPIPRRWCLEGLADSLAWHDTNEVGSANSLRNACRGWRYAVTSVFGSKEDGAAWAIQQPACPPAIVAALTDPDAAPPTPEGAHAFLGLVAAAVGDALAREASLPSD